jgi:Zn ribbon nucleic-acid-binding protein
VVEEIQPRTDVDEEGLMASPYPHSGPLLPCPACHKDTLTLMTMDARVCAVCGTPKRSEDEAARIAQIIAQEQVRTMYP